MKQILYTFIFAIFFICSACQLAPAQQINTISSNCPPTYLTKARINISTIGDINYTPCSGRSSLFNGIVNLSNATVISPGGGTFVSGTGTTNFIPRWTNGATGVLGNTPFSWNGTLYTWTDTALTSEFTMNFRPTNGAGIFEAGDFTTTPTSYIRVTESTGLARLKALTALELDSTSGTATLGDVNDSGNGIKLILTNSNSTITFGTTANQGIFDLSQVLNHKLQRTLTAAGTTGAQVINKPNGSVNFAAAATTLVVTNSVAIATSTINAMAMTNDATCHVKDVERAAGSFTIRMTAACTAETAVAFWVYN